MDGRGDLVGWRCDLRLDIAAIDMKHDDRVQLFSNRTSGSLTIQGLLLLVLVLLYLPLCRQGSAASIPGIQQ